ncbi:MAG: tRNA adenosine(34) deaminase TadA [Gammaproteobacteria bacterium]
MSDDLFWMQRAIQLAEQAGIAGEVPVGAVVVLDGQIIGEGSNRPITNNDPSAHAELVALRQAAEKIGNYRLLDTTLYVTLEPCMMCAGAMVHARVKRLVYGALDFKAGVIQSKTNLLDLSFLNHKVEHEGGVLADECGSLLSEFFRKRR